jgi:hypothetical protein
MRNAKGQFTSNRWLWIVLGAMALAIIFILAIDKENSISISKPVVKADVIEDKYGQKIVEIKKDLLKDLSLGCETKGVKEPDGAILLDTNKEMSIGRYMFQIKTVQYYIKKFEQRDITRVEAIQIAIDPVRATKLAEQILFNEPNGVSNWKLCGDKLGLQKEIEIIKKLQN